METEVTDADLDPLPAGAKEVTAADFDPMSPAVPQFEQKHRDLAAKDASMAARRAAAGMAPGPRQYTDEQLGLEQGLPTETARHLGNLVETQSQPQFQASTLEQQQAPPRQHIPTELESDPLAQMVVAGAVTGPLANAIRPLLAARLGALGGLAAPAARIATSAGEGAAGAKMMGADPKTGAILGGAFGAVPEISVPRTVTKRRAPDCE